jgi:alanyl-tRNA synthetase
MDSKDVRERFLKFFEERGHTIVSSSSLVPNDPSVLLTTAGMQQFKPYYTGDADPMKDFGSKNTVSIQKSFRTSDIDEVGDQTHLTFFEMMGNFSFGGYFKEEAITYAHEFIVGELGLPISYVTVFEGLDSVGVEKDEESRRIWEALGVGDIREDTMEEVFWGPTGLSGPCGPTTEVYCKNAVGEDVEVWNIVFNEFFFDGSREELLSGSSGKKLKPLEIPGVDTGMGFERLMMIVQGKRNVFETDLFAFGGEVSNQRGRVLVDHMRAAAFLISDGVRPSNTDRGYVLRRLLRRAMVHGGGDFDAGEFIEALVRFYGPYYPELNAKVIVAMFGEEREKFGSAMTRGLAKLEKMSSVDAKSAFLLFESYGLPYEVIKEVGGSRAAGLSREAFGAEFARHRQVSRAGAEKKFGGHGLVLDTGELKAGDAEELQKATRLHTATHLLQAGLRKVLGSEVRQMGSDVSAKRTRFDFSFSRKLTDEEVSRVETFMNENVAAELPVNFEEMSLSDAQKTGALHFFKEKYPDRVRVYYIGDSLESAVSKEFCGGPHVSNTKEIGRVRISKQEAVGSGVRRIRAIIE